MKDEKFLVFILGLFFNVGDIEEGGEDIEDGGGGGGEGNVVLIVNLVDFVLRNDIR